ncbi:MAG: hypothetical protein LBU73_01730 [Helicobacteraceae bacterium]|jgi:hypothetical protein|nr:hypothetical protein [Helicobacteraceae bacterium]
MREFLSIGITRHIGIAAVERTLRYAARRGFSFGSFGGCDLTAEKRRFDLAGEIEPRSALKLREKRKNFLRSKKSAYLASVLAAKIRLRYYKERRVKTLFSATLARVISPKFWAKTIRKPRNENI